MNVLQVTADTVILGNDECPLVMALGMFDGVHIAHMKLLETAKEIAIHLGLKLGVMTFFPHPRMVTARSEGQSRHLTPLSKKLELFEEAGVDELYLVRFNRKFAELMPEEFVSRFLADKVRHAVAGFDFRYGHKGLGNIHTLKEQGKGFFDVTVVEEITSLGCKISSTQIRKWIASGEVDLVPEHLGRPYEIGGTVEMTGSDNFFCIVPDADYLLPPTGYYEIDLDSAHCQVKSVNVLMAENGFIECMNPDLRETLRIGEPIRVTWKKQLSANFRRQCLLASLTRT